jgi:4-amino-4-deoxy-L-arabinose transferase-like glycosyltransferase
MVIWLNLSWRPDVSSLPPDSGFYAYIGKAILHGQLPYRDVWDDKPPLGYYLNALGLLVFGQTPWGVWWSSVVWILGCTVLLFLVIKKLFGGTTALVTGAIFLVGLMNLEIFQGGNLMEVYSLAPQICIIGITYFYFTGHRKPWLSVLTGVLTACALLIKQSTIMLGCSSALVMTISALSERKIRDVFKIVLGFLIGFSGLVAVVSVYWLLAGAMGQFLDGAFLQGYSFIGGAQSNFISHFFYTIFKVLPNLYIGWLCLIALLSCVFFIFEKFYQFRMKTVFKPVISPVEWTCLIALVALPLEVLMASLGGKYYGHYFITMLPAVVLAISYPIWRVVSASRKSLKSTGTLLRNGVYLVLAIGTLMWGFASFIHDFPVPKYQSDLTGIFKGHILLNDLEKYIIQTTKPNDEVLVWHIHVRINFNTNRMAPSRFLYPLNLFIPPSEHNTKLEEYVNDLENHPPELIVVQKPSSLSLPFVDEPVDQLCKPYCTTEFEQAIKVPQIRQEWLRFQQFFITHYAEDKRIYDWVVYRKLP